MRRLKAFNVGEIPISELSSDGDDRLVLIDDAIFVSAFAEAGQRVGTELICAGCFDPARALRAVLFLLNGCNDVDEAAGSLGFCHDCYRDLAERQFHDAVLRASKSTDS
jgi:hypothetical protein